LDSVLLDASRSSDGDGIISFLSLGKRLRSNVLYDCQTKSRKNIC
jgi:hypothetical protein